MLYLKVEVSFVFLCVLDQHFSTFASLTFWARSFFFVGSCPLHLRIFSFYPLAAGNTPAVVTPTIWAVSNNCNEEIQKQLFSVCSVLFVFSDLFGLVVFLGVEPFCVKHWWVRLLYHPYCRKNPQPLYSFIAKILWRSAKKDVIDQVSTISFY